MKMNIKVGDTVKVAGKEWDVLKVKKDGYFCLLHEVLPKRRSFSDSGNNNWEWCDLREWLNEEFIKELQEEQLLPMERDLTAEDGLKDYCDCVDKVTLLTCDEYRKYRKFITPVKDWWWTLTADSPTNSLARFVNTGGTLRNYDAYYGYGGVRPALTFSFSIDEINLKQ